MLIRLAIQNFLSFYEEREFQMIAGNYKRHKHHVYQLDEGFEVLRAAAIYGANGAGKSNIVKAVAWLKQLVTEGTANRDNEIAVFPFGLKPESANEPSSVELEFKVDDQVYAYFLAADASSTIVEEWLYDIPKAGEEELIFLRKTTPDGDTSIDVGERFSATDKDKFRYELYAHELRPNQPFLNEANDKLLEWSGPPYDWFKNCLEVVFPDGRYLRHVKRFLEDATFRKHIDTIVTKVDTGLRKLGVQRTEITGIERFGAEFLDAISEASSPGKGAYFAPIVKDDSFSEVLAVEGEKAIIGSFIGEHYTEDLTAPARFTMDKESDGTRRLVEIAPAFVDSIYEGKVYLIDEIGRSMHPVMLKALVRYYLGIDKQHSKGQLIFTTHESHLLDLDMFRQDEIWFVEKDKRGQSDLYSLSEYKPRHDKDIKKGYLSGRYGAIPFVADLASLDWDSHEEKPELQA